MDLRKIKKLIELVEESGISELEVRSGDEAIRIARPAPQAPAAAVAAHPAEAGPARRAAGSGGTVTAPMAGVFYAAPEPGADPFVQVGQPVSAGEVVCIIESMKMMNEIRADRGGVCTAVLGRNGEPVASGDPLFRIG